LLDLFYVTVGYRQILVGPDEKGYRFRRDLLASPIQDRLAHLGIRHHRQLTESRLEFIGGCCAKTDYEFLISAKLTGKLPFPPRSEPLAAEEKKG
jgi:hypothetical protein